MNTFRPTPRSAVLLAAGLLADIPDEPTERTPEQAATALAAYLLDWHRREDRSAWWDYYRWKNDLTEEELLDESRPLAGLEYVDAIDTIDRSVVHRFSFPDQDFKLEDGGQGKDLDSERGLRIHSIDPAARTLDLLVGKNAKWNVPSLRRIAPDPVVRTTDQRARLLEIGKVVRPGLEQLATANPVAHALITRALPRFATGAPLADSESALERARTAGLNLERSVLAIQGPPGTGKTFTGARMITTLLAAGRRVGITGTSHKVIANLLEEVCKAVQEEGIRLQGIQAGSKAAVSHDQVTVVRKNPDAAKTWLEDEDFNLIAGTAWLWARADMRGSVQMLVVDEAGRAAAGLRAVRSPPTRERSRLRFLTRTGRPRRQEVSRPTGACLPGPTAMPYQRSG